MANTPNNAETTKAAAIRAAYDTFRQKMRTLRHDRLEFLKAKFHELDEKKIAQIREQLAK
ncbi:MAG: hypothetical protein PHT12_02380 [Patescibacteria group bacterium]|nr:hypothetical protein [Patescibacteria group bacterium]